MSKTENVNQHKESTKLIPLEIRVDYQVSTTDTVYVSPDYTTRF